MRIKEVVMFLELSLIRPKGLARIDKVAKFMNERNKNRYSDKYNVAEYFNRFNLPIQQQLS